MRIWVATYGYENSELNWQAATRFCVLGATTEEPDKELIEVWKHHIIEQGDDKLFDEILHWATTDNCTHRLFEGEHVRAVLCITEVNDGRFR
jgi:hypothetical protein